jgi:hypothetical protein
MTLPLKCAAHVMRTAAGLLCHDTWRQSVCVCDYCLAPHSPSYDDLTCRVQTDQAAAVLAEINSKNRYVHDLHSFRKPNPCRETITDQLKGGPSIKGDSAA